ncbi:MAG TPA: FAD-linked oxidase C-terminal domain-containing protein, partial [Frankiaceae bacterium]|nr:FAD-linked oxidase C-terminal domain-containing protein [Frankiaceae bacterium]
VPEILSHAPVGLEAFDDGLVRDVRAAGLDPAGVDALPPGGGWLLVELAGDAPGEVAAAVDGLVRALRRSPGTPSVLVVDDPAREASIWRARTAALGATARVPGRRPRHEGWEDSAVDPARIGAYLRDLSALHRQFGYQGSWYGHIGEGCVHTRNDFDLDTAEGVARFRRYVEAAADLCVSYGGSLSGEHGDGQGRGELLTRMFGADLVGAFGAFKAVWDPGGRMNPGKVVDAYPLDSNLAPRPRDLGPTRFGFPADGGSLAAAAARCVGVGTCRRETGGTMCPSYQVTREEIHSTRGRAKLLHEVLLGEVVTGGWRDRALREALDLCLSCKGCKVDCPVSVDMATYKAEFLSHYYAGRLRPVAAYSLGLIHRWARLASRAPGPANALAALPLRRLAGITLARPVPRFARQTLRAWWQARGGSRVVDGPPVLLFADTFTDTLTPHVGRAAVEVLEDAGLSVRIPAPALCCGRPLYDHGMLPTARRLLRRVLDALGPQLAAGTPVVVLEPSCLAVFRDELVGLLPADLDARRLAGQACSLAELLRRLRYAPPPPGGSGTAPVRALVQGHCQARAVVGMAADLAVLRAAGVAAELLDAGCCGLAGSFGFEAAHYGVSMRIGEHGVLPRVRAAAADTLVVADGFSCAAQISHGTGCATRHLAEVLADRIRGR